MNGYELLQETPGTGYEDFDSEHRSIWGGKRIAEVESGKNCAHGYFALN